MKKISFILALLLSFYNVNGFATHIRAGEIHVEVLSGLSVRIRIVAYTDKGSPILFGNGILDFGDGSTPINLDNYITANNSGRVKLNESTIGAVGGQPVGLAIFESIYDYPSTGRYHITYTERNRNDNIKNMTNSVNTTFHIETEFELTNDPFFGVNSSPILSTPPLEEASTGITYFHNPGAYDLDGDSLSYRLVIPLKNVDLEVDNYRSPNDIRFYEGLNYNESNQKADGSPTFSINSQTGLITWDAPGVEGEYNVAFIVEEWRKSKLRNDWINLGFVRRDMQIIVIQGNNERPELDVEDLCVIAGEKIYQNIRGSDPDGHYINISPLGEVLNGQFGVSICTVSEGMENCSASTRFFPSPRDFFFKWDTKCSHVREQPYKITFKIVDNPPPSSRPRLTAFKTMNIRVVGPAPQNLRATKTQNVQAQLNWDSYACQNADSVRIYRKIGAYDFNPEKCEIGLPSISDYEHIESVPLFPRDDDGIRSSTQITTFIDNDENNPLAPGAKYCYRIVAYFYTVKGGESKVSDEVCIEIDDIAPIITHVDVNKTDEKDGEIFIKWLAPTEPSNSLPTPPYTYRLFRYSPLGNRDLLIETQELNWTDQNLDTTIPWQYEVEMYDASNIFYANSALASSVFANTSKSNVSISVTYGQNTPWSNQSKEYPKHKIYRNQLNKNDLEAFEFLDDINVFQDGFYYIDNKSDTNPLEIDTRYCYYVETYGSYENNSLPSPLVNRSQIVCSDLSKEDTSSTQSCGKITVNVEDCKTSLLDAECDLSKAFNMVSWSYEEGVSCNKLNIEKFNVYFSSKVDGEYVFRHSSETFVPLLFDEVSQLGGCYKVGAVDDKGNIVLLSEGECVKKLDECTQYKLPNVFTPNDDGKNDFFTPYKTKTDCPRLVKKIKFDVFNRQGHNIYNHESVDEKSTLISWDGKSKTGEALPSGTYFYEAEVYFDTSDFDFSKKSFNGWIHIFK